MIKSFLNPNLKKIRKIYYFVHNFGKIFHSDPIQLKNGNVFFGINGAGKSMHQDAIKTIHIADDNYIKFNANRKGTHSTNTNSSDYFKLFEIEVKHGPSILGFHFETIDLITDKIIETITFGVTANVDKKKFFVANGIDKDNLNDFIINAKDESDFYKLIKEKITPDSLKRFTTIKEYHKYLHHNNLIFYNYDTEQDYYNFLKLFKDCEEIIQEGKGFQISTLKKLLFVPEKDEDQLNQNFDSIIKTSEQFIRLKKESENKQKELDSISELINSYSNHFSQQFFSKFFRNKSKTQQEIEELKDEIKDFTNQIKDLKVENEEFDKKIYNIDEKLEQIEEKEKIYRKIEDNHDKILKHISSNKEILFQKDAYFQEKIETLKVKIDAKDKNIETLNRKIGGKKASISREKTAIDEVYEHHDNFDEVIDYQKRIKKEKKKIQEELIGNNSKLDENRETIQKNKNVLKTIKIETEELIGNVKSNIPDTFLDLIAEIEHNFDEFTFLISQKKKELQFRLDSIILIEQGREKGIALFEEFGIKKLFRYFEKASLDQADMLETALGSFKDYYIVKKSEHKRLIDFLKDLSIEDLEELKNCSFLVVPDNFDFDHMISLELELVKDYILSEIKILNTLSLKEKKSSAFFGIESRKELKKELDKRLNFITQLEPTIEKLKENKRIIIRLENEIKNLKGKNSKILGGKGYEEWKNHYSKEKSRVENALNEISIKIDSIKKEREEKSRMIKDKEENIKRYEKDISDYEDDIKDSIEEKERKNKKLEELKSTLANKSEITSQFLKTKKSFIILIEQVSLPKLNKTKKNLRQELENWVHTYESDLLIIKEVIKSELKLFTKELMALSKDKGKAQISIEKNKEKIKELKVKKNNLLKFLVSKKSELENSELKIQTILKAKLFDDFQCFDINFKDWYAKKLTELEQNGGQFIDDFSDRFNKAFHFVCEVFGYNSLNINICDLEGLPDIREIMKKLPGGITKKSQVEVERFFQDQINNLKVNILNTAKDYLKYFRTFFSSIEGEIKRLQNQNKNYQKTVENIKFGSIKHIIFKFQKNIHFHNLKELIKKLQKAEKGDNLYNLLDIQDLDKSYDQILFQKIFPKRPFTRKDLFIVYNYFDFSLSKIEKSEVEMPIFSSSGGESSGIEFLIFAIALKTLQKRSECKRGELFIYLDETAKWDPNSFKEIVNFSKNYNLRTIFAQVEPPREINVEGLQLYQIHNAIANEFRPELIIPSSPINSITLKE